MPAPGAQYARPYAQRLLQDLGITTPLSPGPEVHPAQRWAESGNMALTGNPDGPGQMCPVPLASYADGILRALAALAPGAPLAGLDGGRLLTERAALGGYRRAGEVAPGGSCRLLRGQDGWLAVSLPSGHRSNAQCVTAAWQPASSAPDSWASPQPRWTPATNRRALGLWSTCAVTPCHRRLSGRPWSWICRRCGRAPCARTCCSSWVPA